MHIPKNYIHTIKIIVIHLINCKTNSCICSVEGISIVMDSVLWRASCIHFSISKLFQLLNSDFL